MARERPGDSASPFIIAETACAHDGDPETLRTLIREVADADPDAIQVEIFSPEHQVTPDHEMADAVDDLAFSLDTWEDILREMSDLDPATFVFAYDRPSLQFALEHDIDGIKLSSADLANPEMIAASAKADMPTTLSTGGCSVEEIAQSVEQYTEIDNRGPVLMHGVQNFPTAIEDAWLYRIQLLKDLFDLPTGYQDHTDGDSELSQVIDLIALGRGASVLEKHVTLSRGETETDFEAALEPAEFEDYVETVRGASGALGPRRFCSVSSSERKYQAFQKKAVVTTQEIRQGEPIDRDHVEFLRNDSPDGIAPREFEALEGRLAAADLPVFHTLSYDDVEPAETTN